MGFINSALHKIFPNDPKVVRNSIITGAARGAAVGAVTGAVAGIGVGAVPGAIGGANLGALNGAVTGGARYGIGVALWGKGH